MFTEANSKGILGLSDIDQITYLASRGVDYVLGVTITGIFQFYDPTGFVVGDG